MLHRRAITLKTGADEAAVDYIGPITGFVRNILYVKGDYANGVDFAITAETTGVGLWTEADVNASKTVAPMQLPHNQIGEPINGYASPGAEGDTGLQPIGLCSERVKFSITNGGAGKSGTFHLIWEG